MIAFLEGFGIGLSTLLFVGPVLFLIVNSTLQYGVKVGIAACLGIFLSDVIFAIICYYGTSLLIQDLSYQKYLGYGGSIILIGLGIGYLIKSQKNIAPSTGNFSDTRTLSSVFIKGFAINFINPFSLTIWAGFVQYGKGKYEAPLPLIIFITAIIIGVLTMDLLKVFFAHKIKPLLSGNRLQTIFKIVGICLMTLGLYMLYYVLANT